MIDRGFCIVKVNAFSKKTGDYAVLSHPDLCVLALTLELHEAEKGVKELEETVVEEVSDQVDDTVSLPSQYMAFG